MPPASTWISELTIRTEDLWQMLSADPAHPARITGQVNRPRARSRWLDGRFQLLPVDSGRVETGR
ncbi:MAG: hypothetical protein IPM99_12995 [Rubrivivax sp.]|nr:hypothetical protein [Rubrivivax sp.]